MKGLASAPLPPPCTQSGMGQFASKAHYDWLEAETTRIEALFGITQEDALSIARQFRAYPEQRRAPDLVRHAALTLRARKRFLGAKAGAA